MGQNNIDTLSICPFELNIFDFNSEDMNDLKVVQINISENDTLSNDIIAEYKLNSKGQILIKKSIYRKESYQSDTLYNYYTYKYFPTIYSLTSWDNNNDNRDFTSYWIDKTGQRINTTLFKYSENSNSWWSYFNIENTYNSKGQPIKIITRDNKSIPYKETIKIEYYENGHIKMKSTDLNISRRVDTIKYVNLFIDSNNCSINKYDSNSYIKGQELICYNSKGEIISKKYFHVTEYQESKFDTICFEINYEYDIFNRLLKTSNITMDSEGKKIGRIENLYIYKTKHKPNFSEIEDQNDLSSY